MANISGISVRFKPYFRGCYRKWRHWKSLDRNRPWPEM